MDPDGNRNSVIEYYYYYYYYKALYRALLMLYIGFYQNYI